MGTSAPRLVPLEGSTRFPEILLTQTEITLGRSRQNNVCLDDPSVSRGHARIRPENSGFTIEDTGSLHGTIINGKPIKAHRLRPNDTIQIGIFKFRFIDAEASQEESTGLIQSPLDPLRLLLDVTQVISSSLATEEVLKHVIDGVLKVTRAQRGFLMMINESGELDFRVARNFDQTELATAGVTASSSIVNRVRETGKAVVLSNTMEVDPSKSMVAMGIRSVMCVPLKNRDRIFGLIYVDSQRQAERFTQSDLELFESLAGQAALAIEKSQLYEELRRYSTSLEDQVRERTAELIQSERMAAVGRLAAGIAHEINSPLGVITSNVDLLAGLSLASNDPQMAEIAAEIKRTLAAANARLLRIIKAFQALTGLDQAELKPINLNQVIDEVLVLLDAELSSRIQVVKELGELHRVMCSPGKIVQVFMNLLLNAIQAIEGAGSIHIRSEQLKDHVRITIRDTGRGMTPEQIERAFDPGLGKKGGRVSAQLGLMVTNQILREHGGKIQITSAVGSGTTVTVAVPNQVATSVK